MLAVLSLDERSDYYKMNNFRWLNALKGTKIVFFARGNSVEKISLPTQLGQFLLRLSCRTCVAVSCGVVGYEAPVLSYLGSISGRLTSGSRPGQAVPSPFCQRSKDEGKLRPKFTKCEKISIFQHATGFRPPVAMAKPKWRQILLSLTLFSNVTSKEGKPMSCACSVLIPVKRMGVCNFSPMG